MSDAGLQTSTLLVMCDPCDDLGSDGSRQAAALTRDIVSIYRTLWQQYDVTSGQGFRSGSELTDITTCLSYAVASGINRSRNARQMPSMWGAYHVDAPTVEAISTWSILAAVICNNKLIIARRACRHLYLLRAGELHNLISISFMADPMASMTVVDAHSRSNRQETIPISVASFEPQMGLLDLQLNDRLLLCSDVLHDHLPASKIKSLLRAADSSQLAADALIAEVQRTTESASISVIVADLSDRPVEMAPQMTRRMPIQTVAPTHQIAPQPRRQIARTRSQNMVRTGSRALSLPTSRQVVGPLPKSRQVQPASTFSLRDALQDSIQYLLPAPRRNTRPAWEPAAKPDYLIIFAVIAVLVVSALVAYFLVRYGFQDPFAFFGLYQ
jgi:hypothetical protein